MIVLRKILDNVRGESHKRHWIIFDGDVDPEWAENLNSVLDDNKLLTLPNGERLLIPPNVRIMFEVETLKHATPATVLYRQLNDPLPDVQDYVEDLPDELNIVLQRATAKDPTMRYDNALALARDFASVVNRTQGNVPTSEDSTLDVLSLPPSGSPLLLSPSSTPPGWKFSGATVTV